MMANKYSTCFVTKDVDACCEFYQRYFSARVVFDYSWHVDSLIAGYGLPVQFKEPPGDMPTSGGAGTILNLNVDDVDAEHVRITDADLKTPMSLEVAYMGRQTVFCN